MSIVNAECEINMCYTYSIPNNHQWKPMLKPGGAPTASSYLSHPRSPAGTYLDGAGLFHRRQRLSLQLCQLACCQVTVPDGKTAVFGATGQPVLSGGPLQTAYAALLNCCAHQRFGSPRVVVMDVSQNGPTLSMSGGTR